MLYNQKFLILPILSVGLISCGDRLPEELSEKAPQIKDALVEVAKDKMSEIDVLEIGDSALKNLESSLESSTLETEESEQKQGLNGKTENNLLNQYVNSGLTFTKLSNVKVVDGDTVKGFNSNNDKIRVRMVGIDAPESSQSYGKKSTAVLDNCVGYNDVYIVHEKKNYKDRYGRVLGRVISSQNENCNLVQVESGAAWFYRDYQKELLLKERVIFANAENKAKESKVGLWSQRNIQAPWDYRKSKK